MDRHHVLLVTFPAQGHINPSLRLANRLIDLGIEVTFATSLYAQRRMSKPGGERRLNFASFSDGYDDGVNPGSEDAKKYMNEIRNQGSKSLKETILASAANCRPITCLIYTLLLPWASAVARELHIPSALLCIQPATVLDVYYYYFNGYTDEIKAKCNEPMWEIQFPGLPLSFSKRDLPSFMLPSSSDAYAFVLPAFKEQVETLDADDKPKVLVNTFDALESDALRAVDRYELIGVGPLIPPGLTDGGDRSGKSLGGDLFKKSDDYVDWLNSQQDSSVVYVSFGSLSMLKKDQMEEIARGLLDCNRPFLWVIREEEKKESKDDDDNEKLSCLEELEKLGKIVGWCSQVEVLTNPSLGCFVSHCGWNSTLESLSCGVPIVAFPYWTDQGTNAKLIEDVWGVGVRVRVGGEDENWIVGSGEIRRCIEEVMDGGEKSRELRENAEKWKRLAREAVEENGSSNKNLKDFFEQGRSRNENEDEELSVVGRKRERYSVCLHCVMVQ